MKKRTILSEWGLCLAVSCAFAVILSFACMGGDDVASMHLEGGSLAQYWSRCVGMYQTQTARILINFPVFIFTDHSVVLWAAFMGLALFVLMSAMSFLLVERDFRREGNHFIACITMMFPFSVLYEAGWISTATTYLAPAAFGFMALVPIRKILRGEAFRWWEYPAYAACLIYSANLEQMMAVLLACYITAFIYTAFFRRKVSPYLSVLLLLCILSALFIITCPGNGGRVDMEINTKYPPFAMQNVLDKAELGYSTALKWLLFDNQVFVVLACGLLYALVRNRYEDRLFKGLALFPFLVVALTGPLYNVTETLFPYLGSLKEEIPYYGLINLADGGSVLAFGRFFLMSVTVLAICAEMVLLIDDVEICLACAVLVLAGTGSRVVLGFSPTIFASGNRTCTIMSFCIIAAVTLIYMHNIRQGRLSERFRRRTLAVMDVIMAVCFVNLLFLTAAAFRTEFPYSYRLPLL